MMPSLNSIILMGNLTRAPEVRYAPSGLPIATLSLAINNRSKGATGEWTDDPCFIEVVVFDKQAEFCGEHLSKGSPVLIEGQLQQRKWEKDGQKHSKHEIKAFRVQFLPKGERQTVKEADDADVPF